MAVPTPILLFKSNYFSAVDNINGNVIYVEVPVTGAEVNLQVRYSRNGNPAIATANEDVSSAKPGLRRFWFYQVFGFYDIFTQVTVGSNVVQSPRLNVIGFFNSAPRCLQADLVTITDVDVSLNLFGGPTFITPPANIRVLMKVVGAPAYNIITPAQNVFNALNCLVVGLTPNTDYQFIVTTELDDSIAVTNPILIRTQGPGCPAGQPVIGAVGGQRNPYLSYSLPPTLPSAVLTVFSSFANVVGANILCTAYLVDINGGFILADVNTQDNVALTSVHTFSNLNFNTRYSVVTRVANANGFQESRNRPQIETQLALPFAGGPLRGNCLIGLGNNDYKVYVDQLSAQVFFPAANPGLPPAPQNRSRPPFQMTIEVAPTRFFNPTQIVEYAWTRNTPFATSLSANNDLPVGVPLYARCRIYNPVTSSLTYSNTANYDGLATRKI